MPFTWPSSLLSAEPGTGHLLISYCILLPVIYKWDLGSIDIYFLCLDDELSMTQYYYGNLSPSRTRKTRKNKDILRTKQAIIHNLVPRALFPGGGGAVSQRFGHPRVLGVPIPISLAFWVSPSHITATFWASPGTLPGCPNP